ncbi:MAG: hypothetical protein P8181_10445 [bacterium]
MNRLKAMTAGQILDRALKLLANNLALAVGIVALVYVPYYAVVFYLESSAPGDEPGVAASFIGFVTTLLWIGFLMPLATGAMTFAVSERYLNRPVSIGEAFGKAVRRFGVLIIAQIIAGIIVFLGYLLFIIPGILWWLSYALIAPVVMLESLGPDRSRVRSKELASGLRWKIFVVTLVIGLGGLFVYGGLGFIVGLTLPPDSPSAALASRVIQVLVELIQFPLGSIATVLIYYDARIRKEGFDLEMLSNALGRQPV